MRIWRKCDGQRETTGETLTQFLRHPIGKLHQPRAILQAMGLLPKLLNRCLINPKNGRHFLLVGMASFTSLPPCVKPV